MESFTHSLASHASALRSNDKPIHTCTEPGLACDGCLSQMAFFLADEMDFKLGAARDMPISWYQCQPGEDVCSLNRAVELKIATLAACREQMAARRGPVKPPAQPRIVLPVCVAEEDEFRRHFTAGKFSEEGIPETDFAGLGISAGDMALGETAWKRMRRATKRLLTFAGVTVFAYALLLLCTL